MFGKYTFVEKKPKKLFEKFFKINKKKIIGIFDIDIKDNVTELEYQKNSRTYFIMILLKLLINS